MGRRKKGLYTKIQNKKKEIEKARFDLEQAENKYDLETAARLRHGTLPRLEKRTRRVKK